jgi:type IV pilus assembly protein PilA
MFTTFTKRKHEKGFTILELMIVIAIIGILAAIAIPNFIRYKNNAADISAQSTAKNAFTAALVYLSDNPNKEWSDLTDTMLAEGGFRDTENVITTKLSGAGSVITSTPVGGKHYYTVSETGSIMEVDK